MHLIECQYAPRLFEKKGLMLLLICLLGCQKLMANDIISPNSRFFSSEPLPGQQFLEKVKGDIFINRSGSEASLGMNNHSHNFIDTILIDATSNMIIRSFSDLPGGIRVTHGVNVGSPAQVHYTYDLDKGMIVQLWRGRFLDATPMWQDRGDGSSRPNGKVQYLGKPVPAIEKLNNAQAAWVQDTTGTGFKPKGYVLNKSGQPTFRYIIYGLLVNDASTVLENGKGIHREITLQQQADGLFMHLATGNHIKITSDGLYAIDDKPYYIRIDDAGENKPVIRDTDGKQEIIIPIQKKLTYSILFY